LSWQLCARDRHNYWSVTPCTLYSYIKFLGVVVFFIFHYKNFIVWKAMRAMRMAIQITDLSIPTLIVHRLLDALYTN
jgi:hypothetical protein